MVKLSRIDFMTTDLQRLRIALTLPNDLKPRPGGVHLDLAYRQGDKPEVKRVINLEESSAAPDLVGLPADGEGKKTYVYRLPLAPINELNKIRYEVIVAKSKNEKGSLTMGIAAKEFCANTKISNAPLLVTTYVQSSENDGYVVLTQDIDLRSDATISASLDHLEPCHK